MFDASLSAGIIRSHDKVEDSRGKAVSGQLLCFIPNSRWHGRLARDSDLRTGETPVPLMKTIIIHLNFSISYSNIFKNIRIRIVRSSHVGRALSLLQFNRVRPRPDLLVIRFHQHFAPAVLLVHCRGVPVGAGVRLLDRY